MVDDDGGDTNKYVLDEDVFNKRARELEHKGLIKIHSYEYYKEKSKAEELCKYAN